LGKLLAGFSAAGLLIAWLQVTDRPERLTESPTPPDVIQVTPDGIFYTFSDPTASSSRGDPTASTAGQFAS
jgi:hypothetical protein